MEIHGITSTTQHHSREYVGTIPVHDLTEALRERPFNKPRINFNPNTGALSITEVYPDGKVINFYTWGNVQAYEFNVFKLLSSEDSLFPEDAFERLVRFIELITGLSLERVEADDLPDGGMAAEFIFPKP